MEDIDIQRVYWLLDLIYRKLTHNHIDAAVFSFSHDHLLEIYSYLHAYYEFLESRLASFIFNRHNNSDPEREITFTHYIGRQIVSCSYWKSYYQRSMAIENALSAIETILREYKPIYALSKPLLLTLHEVLSKLHMSLKNTKTPDITVC